jgi:hypothetical protein
MIGSRSRLPHLYMTRIGARNSIMLEGLDRWTNAPLRGDGRGRDCEGARRCRPVRMVALQLPGTRQSWRDASAQRWRSQLSRCLPYTGCSYGDIMSEPRRGLIDYRTCALTRPGFVPRGTDDTASSVRFARRIWDNALAPRGTPVAYLAGRGITIAPPSCLRWARALRRPDGAHGAAIVARLDSPRSEPIDIQRTWIKRDGTGRWPRDIRAGLPAAPYGLLRRRNRASNLPFCDAGDRITGLGRAVYLDRRWSDWYYRPRCVP